MSDLKLPGEQNKPKGPSWTRIGIWLFVGAVGLYLVISGLVGVFVKGG